MQRTNATPIGALAQVNDLPHDARAMPEPGMAYDLRLIDAPPLGIQVEFVFRREDQLLAHASDGQDYPVTGTGNYILLPHNP